MPILRSSLIALALVTGLTNAATASVTQINSQAAFSLAGTITQNTNFDDITAAFTSLDNPAIIGDLTFSSGDNVIIGASDTYWHPVRSVLAYDHWSPLPGTISGHHDLFGFNLGFLGMGPSTSLTVTLTTNVGSYHFLFNNPPQASEALQFTGFQSSKGEIFTGFSISSAQGYGYAPVLTDLQLGVAAVPEPETYAMLLAGLGMLGVASRRRHAAQA